MSEHRAVIRWQRAGPGFLQGKYSREQCFIANSIKTEVVVNRHLPLAPPVQAPDEHAN